MSGTLQLVVCTNDVILFGKNINIVNENSMKTQKTCFFFLTQAGPDINSKKLGTIELGFNIVKGAE